MLSVLGLPLSAQDIDTAYKNTPIEKVFSGVSRFLVGINLLA